MREITATDLLGSPGRRPPGLARHPLRRRKGAETVGPGIDCESAANLAI